jgi:hypothetical protein
MKQMNKVVLSLIELREEKFGEISLRHFLEALLLLNYVRIASSALFPEFPQFIIFL